MAKQRRWRMNMVCSAARRWRQHLAGRKSNHCAVWRRRKCAAGKQRGNGGGAVSAVVGTRDAA